MNSNYSLDEKAKEYLDAEITLLFLLDETTNKQELNILTVIEFRPEDQEKSEIITTRGRSSNIFPVKRLKLNNKKTILVSRLFLPVKEGIDIYRSMRTHNCNLTIDGKYYFDLKNAGVLTEEPPKESLVLIPPNLFEGTSIGAVLPKRKMSSKVIALMDVEKKTLAMLTTEEKESILGFAKKELGIDLLNYEEYIGSCILRLPNPLLRKIDISLSTNDDFILKLFERKGKSIINGVVELADKRLLGNGFVIRKKIKKTRLIISLPYKPERLKIRIFDPNDELIEEFESSFNRILDISLEIISEKRLINSTDPKYSTELDVISETIKSGDNSINTVEKILIESDIERELNGLEEKRVFMYFPGGTNESSARAKGIVRELLKSVKERCIICDPYFSSSDVAQYALMVRYSQVKVRLISSIAFLKDRVDRNMAQSQTHAEEILQTLRNLKEQDSRLNIECRALIGRDKSPLHDRFLVIDNEVYLLGSSLNEFGSRATTLFRAPNSRVLIDAAETWWSSDKHTIDLNNWRYKKEIIVKEENRTSKLGRLYQWFVARFARNNS